ARGVPVRIVVGDTLLGLERLDAGDETRPRDADRHRLGLVAVHAGQRVLDERLPAIVLQIAGLAVGHGRDPLEPILDVALADEPIESEVRGVTLQARAGLLALCHAPGLFLIEQRVEVAAPVAVVERESVAREDPLEPRIAVELLRRWTAIARAETTAPHLVVVGRDVRRYESYSKGQFWPQTFGSIVSSVTSTIRTKGCRASCLRSKMFVRSANKITLRPAMPNSASSGSSQVRHLPISRPSAAGAVPGGGVAVETIEAPVRPPGRIDHGVDECLVAAYAVLADDVAVARRDLDRLLEVLQGEGGGVAKAVVGLRRPLREARVRQMTLDARRG